MVASRWVTEKHYEDLYVGCYDAVVATIFPSSTKKTWFVDFYLPGCHTSKKYLPHDELKIEVVAAVDRFITFASMDPPATD